MRNIEKAKDPRGTLRRLLGYLGGYKFHIIAVSIITIIGTLLSLAGPYLIGVAIDKYIIPRDLAGLVRISLTLAGIYAASTVTSMVAGWAMATISQSSLKKLRKELGLRGTLTIQPASGTAHG